ncbi:MAG: hypothetical protein U1F77_05915 [Kiritimatiellia bacterium]
MNKAFRAFLLLAAAMSPFGAGGTPYDGKVFITGIYDADPSDEAIPPLRNFAYKALEFFSEVDITAAEAPKFAIRVYNDSVTAGFNPSSDAAFASGSSVAANSRFYAVKDATAFDNLYNNTAAVQDWNDRNGGPANIVYEGTQLLNFDGNEVYQLVYYPNGIGSPAGLVVLDTYGQTNYPAPRTSRRCPPSPTTTVGPTGCPPPRATAPSSTPRSGSSTVPTPSRTSP